MTELTDDDITKIARATAAHLAATVDDRVAKKLELTLGINCRDAEERAETRKDMEGLRSFRLMVQKSSQRVGMAIIVAAIGGVFALAGLGWKPEFFGK
jgi:molybdopterin-biosynthesis enzyme MoeA-like protein